MNDTSISQNQTPVRQDRKGSNNPFYGHRHTTQSREKMSHAATERNKQYQKWKDSQHHLTMAEFLSNNPTVEEYIKTFVRESIEGLLWKERKNQL